MILPEIDDGPLGRMIYDGHRQSLLFAPEYARVAQAHRIDFLDAAQYAVADPADCVHIGAGVTPCARRGRRGEGARDVRRINRKIFR